MKKRMLGLFLLMVLTMSLVIIASDSSQHTSHVYNDYHTIGYSQLKYEYYAIKHHLYEYIFCIRFEPYTGTFAGTRKWHERLRNHPSMPCDAKLQKAIIEGLQYISCLYEYKCTWCPEPILYNCDFARKEGILACDIVYSWAFEILTPRAIDAIIRGTPVYVVGYVPGIGDIYPYARFTELLSLRDFQKND